MKSRIFILEDHPMMRRGCRVQINGEMDLEACGERAIHAGASGYLMEKEAERNVIPTIRRVLEGRYAVSERIEDRIMLQFAGRIPGKQAAEYHDSLSQLSDRKLEVFELHGRRLSTREMVEALHVRPKTIATHRGRIKIKLAVESTPELIRRAVI